MVYELSNPVAKTLLNHLRDANTDALRFRHIVKELTRLLIYESLANQASKPKEIDTWLGKKSFDFIDESELLFVTVLRAGLPMIEAAMEVFPNASAGFLGIKRDETTHKSTLYYDRVPDCTDKTVILVDPMVATGGSLLDGLNIVSKRSPAKIISFNLVGAPEGLDKISHQYPDLELYIAQIDERLNDDKYILPGLGDAGDRAYNTME